MKHIKVLVVHNGAPWPSMGEKLGFLGQWFAPKVELRFDVKQTDYAVIPFTSSGVSDDRADLSTHALAVDDVWYDRNVAALALGYDIVLFVVPVPQWPTTNSARGWRRDRNMGPVELQIAADEHEKIFFPNGRQEYTFIEHGRHELLHALYMIAGQTDLTHQAQDRDDYDSALRLLVMPDVRTDEIRTLKVQLLTLMQTLLTFLYRKKAEIEAEEYPDAPTPRDRTNEWALAIQEHEGYFAPGENPAYPNGSLAWRNKNPGNFKYIGQYTAIGENKGFAVFPSYDVGFAHLKTILRNAATGRSRVYRPEMTLYQFFATYAPREDDNDPVVYAETVARRIGVVPWTQIRYLVA